MKPDPIATYINRETLRVATPILIHAGWEQTPRKPRWKRFLLELRRRANGVLDALMGRVYEPEEW